MDEEKTTGYHYAYRSYGDQAGTGPMTMKSDPGTGEVETIHPAGTVMVFDSEEARDAYVAKKVVITTLEGGQDRKFHWVTAISAMEADDFSERCRADLLCIHKSGARRGEVRIPQE